MSRISESKSCDVPLNRLEFKGHLEHLLFDKILRQNRPEMIFFVGMLLKRLLLVCLLYVNF